jgi:REP element-mobilizing transposase RayT
MIYEHHRRTPRLKDYDYSSDGAYFVTICTHNRECTLGDIIDSEMHLTEYGKIVRDEWHKLPNRYTSIGLDVVVIMPNHIHAIIVIHDVGAIHELPLRNDMAYRRRMLIPTIIGYVKMKTAKRINQSRNTPGIHVWQRNYHEHVIRDEADLRRIREYIADNPVKWDTDSENLENIGQRR